MGKAWQQRDEAVVDATVEQVWDAIASGPGIDAWFMGRTTVKPGPTGTVNTDVGGFTMTSNVTEWERPHRFGYRNDGPGERFIAFEYLVEGRDQGTTVVRVVSSGFLPGDDWEAEFDAMRKGGEMYFRTMVAYLNHFAGRTGPIVNVSGPPVTDWGAAWTALRDALGVGQEPAVGDPVHVTVAGFGPVDGVVDFVNPDAIGVRTDDGLFRFIKGFVGSWVAAHHLFRPADEAEINVAWRAWLSALQ
jgi:uncharacterized protein YndB with AHSA1/START domain